jgi:hypothetical protein
MEPGLIGFMVVCGVVVVSGLIALSERRMKQDFVNQTRTQWMRAGRVIQWGPEGTDCYGVSRPQSVYYEANFGVLGVVDRHVAFTGRRNANCDAYIPLEQIAGLVSCPIQVRQGKASVEKKAVEVHTENRGHWLVYTFTPRDPFQFVEAIHRHTGRTILERTLPKQPTEANAVLMRQDVYGEWREEQAGELYFAPDRIVFDWYSLIHFSQIRRVDIFERGGLGSLNPFAQELVRIEYQGTEQKFQVIGFLLRGADKWADKLSAYTGIPVESHIGRKKKEHD